MTKDEKLALAGAMGVELRVDLFDKLAYVTDWNNILFFAGNPVVQMLAVERLGIKLIPDFSSTERRFMAEIPNEEPVFADTPSKAVEKCLREYAKMLVERANDG